MRVLRATSVACCAVLASAFAASAQVPDLVSDRPDFTESAVSAARGFVQLEAGYTYGREAGDAVHTLGEVLLRGGIGRGVELRVALNSYVIADVAGATVRGIEDAAVGAKLAVLPGGGLVPTTALIAMAGIPTGANAVTADAVQGEVVGSFAWELPASFSLGVNAGFLAGALDEGGDDTWSGSVALGRALSDRVGAYAEAYGFTAGDGRLFLDGGLTIALGPDLQLDARVAAQVAGGGRSREFGIGVVHRWR